MQNNFLRFVPKLPGAAQRDKERLNALKHIDIGEVPAIAIKWQHPETGYIRYGVLRHAENGDFHVAISWLGVDGNWVAFADKTARWELTRRDFETGAAETYPIWWNRATGLVIDRDENASALPKKAAA